MAGDLDVLPVVAVSDERRKLVDFGLPHTETFDAFFARRGDGTIPDLRAAEGKTIGVMRSDAAHSEPVERGFRGRIELVDTIRSILDAARRDATERRRAEEALRESEQGFRDLFERHLAATLIIDPDTGGIVDANQAAVDFYGWPRDRLRRMRIQEINTLSPADVEDEISRARSQGSMHFEFRHRLADGSIRDVDVFTARVVVHGKDQLHSTIHDSTARKRAQEALDAASAQLALNSRLAALGTLVAGVAHEVNNPLAASLSDQELASRAVQELRARLRSDGPIDREGAIRHLD